MSSRAIVSSASEAPSRVRYGVLAFACALSMITYLDRVCIASAATWLVNDLQLNGIADLSLAFTAFAFAYAAFEVPSGWLGDVYGPRKTLIRIVIWWSIFTAVTGVIGLRLGGYVMGGITTLIVVRFLFGMGEAGAYPNITRSLQNWFPYQERGFAQGMVWMSGRFMGGVTPMIWTVLIAGVSTSSLSDSGETITHAILPPLLHWRSAFWLFGLLGLAWCLGFGLWFRNRPSEKAGVNAAELEWIEGAEGPAQDAHSGVPWRKILGSSNLWALCLMYACGAYGWYFNITYLPRYLEEQHGVLPTSLLGAVYKGGPLWLGALGCLLGGILTDRYIRKTGNRKMGRRLFGVLGHSLCGLCYFACPFMTTPSTFFVAISFAAFFNDLTMGPAWATCQDIGKRYAGIVAGCMNTVGNLGGALAGYVTGQILHSSLDAHAARLGTTVEKLSAVEKAAGQHEGYELSFFIFGVVYAIAVLLWLRIDATKPVAEEHAPVV
jgi:ACS family glucarate transporter-like MFS transporter